jgi:hypothetical protein
VGVVGTGGNLTGHGEVQVLDCALAAAAAAVQSAMAAMPGYDHVAIRQLTTLA